MPSIVLTKKNGTLANPPMGLKLDLIVETERYYRYQSVQLMNPQIVQVQQYDANKNELEIVWQSENLLYTFFTLDSRMFSLQINSAKKTRQFLNL